MTIERIGSGHPSSGLRRLAVLTALVAAAALVTLTGCRPPARATDPATPALAAGTSTHTITVDGTVRSYLVHRPAASKGEAMPLVVVLHGGFGSAAQAERSYGWDALADSAGVLVAYPDGQGRAWDVGGGCCGVPGRTGVDDVRFVTAMVAALEQQASVDPRRIYATGISNGGMLAYRLACDSAVLAAIGPDSATLLGTCPHPAPLSVIHIHGTADRNIPYAGGQGDGVARIDGPAVPDVVASWRAVDRCATPAASVAGVVTTSVASCPQGRAVELVTIDGAGHQWPGAPASAVAGLVPGIDPPSTALDATATIWAFFAAHPRAT